MWFLFVRPELCPWVSRFPTSSFLQIPPHDGHPCLRLYPSHYRADSGLSPVRMCARRAHHKNAALSRNQGGIHIRFKVISWTLWTTHCLKPMGFLLYRPRNLLSPQALIRTVPTLFIIFSYAICLSPSASIFFAALISLSCFTPQAAHSHFLTDKSFVSVFWYPQTEQIWLLA